MKSHTTKVLCPWCHGNGYAREALFPSLLPTKTIDTTVSTTKYVKKPCTHCHGAGWVEREES